jgi:hypothetical protein
VVKPADASEIDFADTDLREILHHAISDLLRDKRRPGSSNDDCDQCECTDRSAPSHLKHARIVARSGHPESIGVVRRALRRKGSRSEWGVRLTPRHRDAFSLELLPNVGSDSSSPRLSDLH